MRTLDENESDLLITDVANFYDYTQTLISDPNATPSNFDIELSPDSANKLIENTFNYYFARQNDKLVDEMMDTLMHVFTLNSNDMIPTQDIGLTFNDLRSNLEDYFTNTLGAEGQFTLADAEIEISGSVATLTLVGVFGQNEIDVHFISPAGFGSGDKWSIWEKGGKHGTSAYDGIYGSPEILTNAINFDLNLYSYSYMVNITSYGAGAPSTSSSTYAPGTYSAPNNPMHTYNSTFWENTLMHLMWYGPGNSDSEEDWVIPSAMAYYRTWIPIVAATYVSPSNKTLRDLRVGSDNIPNAGVVYRVLHRLKQLRAGDVVTGGPLPTPLSL